MIHVVNFQLGVAVAAIAIFLHFTVLSFMITRVS